VAAAFTTVNTRAAPDLHTHLAVANKVQTLDGRWLSIDRRIRRAYQVEIFGPVAHPSAPSTHRRGEGLAAQTDYGLSLAVQKTDTVNGLALAERVDVGMVDINDLTSTDAVIAPFGGVGLSGNGYRIGDLEANLQQRPRDAALPDAPIRDWPGRNGA
jgi:hypothetical protein